MINSPFTLLRQFERQLTVTLFTKKDDIRSDADAARALGMTQTAGLNQMHGKRTVIIRSPRARSDEADGMITDVRDLVLCLRVADCQSFVIYEPVKNILGILHVGWKGLIAGAILEFFRVLKQEWGIDAIETYVGAGPSLCTTCADFTDPARELPSMSPEFVRGKCVDLQRAATQEFLDFGVKKERFERMSGCTRCSPELYWTYRGGDREAVKAGHTNMLVCALGNDK